MQCNRKRVFDKKLGRFVVISKQDLAIINRLRTGVTEDASWDDPEKVKNSFFHLHCLYVMITNLPDFNSLMSAHAPY